MQTTISSGPPLIRGQRIGTEERTVRSGGMLVERIAYHAVAAPQRLAICESARTLTYAEVNRAADQLADHLRDVAGFAPGGCVALLLDRSADFVIAALAVLKAGGAYLPLDPATPADRATFILADADARMLLTHHGKARNFYTGACRVVELDGPEGAEIARRVVEPADHATTSEDLAYVIYTSGSAGRPKGVEITHGNLLNLVNWHVEAFGVTSEDRTSHVAGLGFDAAGWEIWPALSAGASLHLPSESTRRSAHLLHEWLLAQRITLAFVPTLLAEQLLHMRWPGETALRVLLTGADTLHRRPAEGLPFTFVNNYGPTECTVVSTSGVVLPTATSDGPPSIGRPIRNSTALILDESLRPVPAGEPGELCMAGALVGRGYRNNPDLTASKFVAYHPASGAPMRIYRTGDRAKLLPNGEIAFLGRLDDQVKIRGYRIELGEIVACLERYPAVEASAVVVQNEPATGEPMLVAYVVAERNASLTAADLRQHLAARLPEYMLPARFVKIGQLPLTSNGKLDKAALAAPDDRNVLPDPKSPAPVAAPASSLSAATDIPGRVERLVASLLNRPSVGHADNFFMLGGHSMLGAQLVARIRDSFGVKLSLRQLFTAPTIAALSAEIAKLTAAAPASDSGR